MKREIHPAKHIGGTVTVPGDKSMAQRAALLSILAEDTVTVNNFPSGADGQTSLTAAQAFGVTIVTVGENSLTLTPPSTLSLASGAIVECNNSGTTARLLAGLVAGSSVDVILSGDESLSKRPMDRIVAPLSKMGAEVFATDDHLPLKVHGKKLLPFEYRLPLPSAQVKSALLLAGLASGCSVTLREDIVSRDHTELMIGALGGDISVRDVKPVRQEDPNDPRKSRVIMPEPFRREIILGARAHIKGGQVDLPGDFSTAANFFAVAALSGRSVTVEKVGLNPTRTAFLDHLKACGCQVDISAKETLGGEPRGNVTVTGGPLKARKISGDVTVGLIDEIPIVAVMAAFAKGTTVIRDAAELRVKESDRLAAISHNLGLMGVSCGLLEDGLVIEGANEPAGADFESFGDHRIVMAFAVAAVCATGPSTMDDDAAVNVSCPEFFELLGGIAQ